MNLEVLLESPSGQLLPWPGGKATVSELTWVLHGGPETALVQLGAAVSLEEMAAYLGWKVLISNRYQTPVWWGFVEEIEASQEGSLKRLSLQTLANRVGVIYQSQTPGGDFGLKAQSPWVEDLASQASFGVREDLLRLGSMGEEEAFLHARKALSERAFPKPQISPTTKINDSGVLLRCSGWFKTLAWRHYSPGSSLFGNMGVQSGTSSLGMEAACLRLAQSFKPAVAMQVSFVALRLRKIGNPSDNLLVQIQTDAAGAPSGTILTSTTLAPAALSAESYAWVRLALGTELSLDPTQTYWLVILRSGALSASQGFALALDQGLNFRGGNLLKFNQPTALWEKLSPEADVLFKVGGLRSTKVLMQEVFEACGQKLTGLSVEVTSSPQITCLDDQVEDGAAAMQRLLDLGDGLMNSLLATVDPEGRMRIGPLSADLPVYHRGRAGNLLTNRGFPIEEALSPVGSVFTQGFAQSLISHASFDALSGQYHLQA
jgi:hypothetical protein